MEEEPFELPFELLLLEEPLELPERLLLRDLDFCWGILPSHPPLLRSRFTTQPVFGTYPNTDVQTRDAGQCQFILQPFKPLQSG